MVKSIIGALALLIAVGSTRAQEPYVKFRIVDAVCQSYHGSWDDTDKDGEAFASSKPIVECTITNPDRAECTIPNIPAQFEGVATTVDGDPALQVEAKQNPDAVIQIQLHDPKHVLFRFFNDRMKQGIQCFGSTQVVSSNVKDSPKRQPEGVHSI